MDEVTFATSSMQMVSIKQSNNSLNYSPSKCVTTLACITLKHLASSYSLEYIC